MIRTVSVIALCGIAALGCKQKVDLGGEFRTVLDVEPEPITKLDILFVVDNSGSMDDEQRDLVDAAGAQLFGTLEDELGELPDMHIAVISTDVGAGAYNISGCGFPPDQGDGEFLNQPRTNGCTPPDGLYIEDAPAPGGGRTGNYDGELADVFACIARLGHEGCGFEQPLESARRSLDGRHPEHDGFLRDDALLLLVILTDEDDCSVFDTVMFDTSQSEIDDPLGPLSSYRCFEFGVACDQEPRTVGERTNCRVRDDSEYMTSIAEFADFFRGLKSDPSHVAVSIISGGTEPLGVHDRLPERYDVYPELDPVCERLPPPECDGIVWPPDAGVSDSGVPVDAGGLTPADCIGGDRTFPSVRLAAFLDEFPGRAQFTPLCELSIASHLESTARLAADVMGRRSCLRGTLVDANPDRAGVQVECRGYDVVVEGGAVRDRTSVPSCADSGGATPCFSLVEDDSCAHVDTKLAAKVQRDGPGAAPAHFVVECLAPLRGAR